jgi:hypothetical protein
MFHVEHYPIMGNSTQLAHLPDALLLHQQEIEHHKLTFSASRTPHDCQAIGPLCPYRCDQQHAA